MGARRTAPYGEPLVAVMLLAREQEAAAAARRRRAAPSPKAVTRGDAVAATRSPENDGAKAQCSASDGKRWDGLLDRVAMLDALFDPGVRIGAQWSAVTPTRKHARERRTLTSHLASVGRRAGACGRRRSDPRSRRDLPARLARARTHWRCFDSKFQKAPPPPRPRSPRSRLAAAAAGDCAVDEATRGRGAFIAVDA
jgi:hypothetical protein